ncbi:expressed protein [Phakopsora pachyrhizi]|uniref:Expressed protein n=1 Tax=Phakopsora pachyrhizi TaxID=170000 RepID=A0AAV0BEU4_PHAPC|nr:expressed protein [Phakopsora pachyrhizi]
MEVDEDFDDPNDRRPQRLLDALIQRDDEFSDSEDEGEGGRRDIQSHKRLRNRLHQSPQTNGRRPSLKPAVLKPPQRTTRRSGTTYDVTRSRQSSLSSSTTTSATPNLRSRLHDEASDSKLGEVGLSTHTSSPCATRWADKANPQMIHDSADAPLPNVNQVVTKLPDSRTISGSPLSRRSPSERRSPPPETLNSVLDPIVQSSTSTLTPSSQPNGILESVKKAVEEPIEMNESSLISDQSTSALELMPTDETAHPIINQVENESDVNVITNSLVQSMENSVDTQKVLSTEIEMEIEMDAPNVEANTQELDDTMEVDKVDASEEFIKQESGEAEQLTEQIAKFLPEKMDVDIVAIEQTPEEIALTSINLKDEEKFEKTEITLGLEEIGTRLDKSQAQLGVLASTSFPPVEGSTSSLPIEPSFKTDPLKDTEMVGMIKSLRSPRLEANETMSTGALETKISSQLHEPELDPKAELERMANQLVEEVERESLKAVIQPATKDEKGSDVENDAARENEKVKETDPQAKQNITLIEVEHDPRLPTLGSREEEQVLELSTKPVEDYKVTLLESLCAAVERKDKAFEDRSGVEQGGDMMVQRAVNPMMDPQLNHVPVTKQVSQPFVRPGGTHTQDLNSGVVESSSVTTTDSNSGSGSGKERAEIEERLGGELSVEKGFDERRRDEKEEDSESFKKSSMSSIDPLITSSSLT